MPLASGTVVGAVNVAVTFFEASIVRLQGLPCPVQSPPQSPKLEVPVGVAVNVTVVGVAKLALQVPTLPLEQLIPPRLLVTVPVPVPPTETLTWTVPGGRRLPDNETTVVQVPPCGLTVSVITLPATDPLKVPLPVLCKTLFLNSINVKVPLN